MIWAGAWLLAAVAAAALTASAQPQERSSQPGGTRPGTRSAVPRAVDGSRSDWSGEPLWIDAGRRIADPGYLIDVQQVYVANDRENLFLFLVCSPSIAKRFKEQALPGYICDLYVDADGNSETGSADGDLGAFGYDPGYEMRISVSMEIVGEGRGGRQPVVRYDVSTLDHERLAKALAAITNTPQATVLRQLARRSELWGVVEDGSAVSGRAGSPIAHGEDGVEMALPMRLLNIRPGTSIRLMMAEGASDFTMEGYGVRYHTIFEERGPSAPSTNRPPAAPRPPTGGARGRGPRPGVAASAAALLALAAGPASAGAAEPAAPSPAAETVAFRVNGEAVTAQSLLAGVEEASALAPDVCPTDTAAGCAARRERLLRLLPQRQFLDREGVEVAPAEIDARIAQMKRDPNPFGRHPPKPLLDVMTRECIPWEELRLMIRVDLGMRRWAERQWDRRWPSAAAWASRAAEQRTEFDRRYGRFRRLAFSLERWPAGARDEDEAMAALREQASRARERLDRGEDFDAVAAELRGPAAGAPGSGAGEVLPFTCLGDANVEALRGLAEGAASAPVQTRFAWIILRREPATDADVRQTLREEFILSVRSEKEKEIVSGARVEEGAPPGRSGEEEQR